MPELDPQFVARMLALHGRAGQRWLNQLPAQLAAVTEHYDLTLGAAYPPAYHYVTRATRNADGAAVVLKLTIPGNETLAQEAATLHYYNQHHAPVVHLVEFNPTLGVLLLEWLTPGTPLIALTPAEDAQATEIMAQAIATLHTCPPPATTQLFSGFRRWLRSLTRYARHELNSGPLPAQLVLAAQKAAAELMRTPKTQWRLLHGDLHHENLLLGANGWRIIDPKGVLAPPAYEVGSMLCNPLDIDTWPNLAATLSQRTHQLATALNQTETAICQAGLLHAVLMAVWDWEDEQTVGSLSVANYFYQRLLPPL